MSDSNQPKLFGVLAEFANPHDLLKAAEKIRDKGFRFWDTHTPFPVHGMDKAMGLGDSKLGILVFVCALFGVSGAFALQWWASSVIYPIVISGKPFNSYPAYVPITFEGGILFSAFAAIFGMLAINKLPQYYHSLFRSKNFLRFSDDGFFVSIEAKDPQFDASSTKAFLEEIGGKNIELIED